MVADRDECPRLDGRVDRAAGVREDQAAHAEATEHPHAEDDVRRRQPLVEVRTALHHGDGHVAEAPEDERARMADRGRGGPPRDVAVRQLDRLRDRVGKPAEAAPEHHADPRPQLGAGGDRGNRGVERLAQTDPSAARASIISTMRCTASCGSSVRCRSSRSAADTSPSASISSRTHSSISAQ